MAATILLYHNPGCSKSRAALELLRANFVEPTIIEYLKSAPTVAEIVDLIASLDVEPHAILRTKEAAYQDLGLGPASTAEEVATAVAAQPNLLERPIAVRGRKAVIGRPPEKVLELL